MKTKIFCNRELDFLQYGTEVVEPMYIFKRAGRKSRDEIKTFFWKVNIF